MPAPGTDQQSVTAAPSMSYGVLSREERKQMLGLDGPEQLEWRHWTPGTEYVKQLVIKNVSTSVLKMRYKQPSSKAFSMDFPEPFKLRPGMSQSLKVIFRPLKLVQYSDHIELFVGNTSFQIPVNAYTPSIHIEVPDSLDFGFTPCKETVRAPLLVRNSGDVRVDVQWRLEAPFAINPPSASLAPGEAMSFSVAFTPPEACSYTANAACTLESGAAAICKISGIGKFPYLSVEQAGVDFGPVVVGQRVERLVRFGNHSMVPANFAVAHDEGPDDVVFTLGPAKGTLGPEEYSVLRVTYAPHSTGTFSSETFKIGTLGGNTVSVNLRGTAVAPTITLSTRAFNFGNLAIGATASRVLYVRNHSAVPVPYDFQSEPLDVFAISRVRGVLPPETTIHVTITCRATVPANYWRRLALLLKDAEPQGVDLVATVYSDKSRPPPLALRHIERYLDRVSQGSPAVEAIHLESLPPSAAGTLYALDNDLHLPPTPLPADADGADGAGSDVVAARLPGPDGWWLAFNGSDPAGALVVDVDCLEFGSCSRLSAAEYRTVTVTNTTPAKLTAFIVVPEWIDPGAPVGEAPQKVFQVFPDSTDIRPRGQVTFKVAFRPPRDGAFFCQQLMLVAHIKSQRNFRLVADHQMLPSWCMELRALGNTFLHCNPEFSPKVELSTRHVSFPPCRPGESVYQTLLIGNSGDTPASFSFGAAGALGPAFSVRPLRGVVPPKGHVLVALRFSPSDTRPATASALVTFNGVASNAVSVALRGCAHTPRLTTDMPSGTLYFRPTCVGASSQRATTLHNPSRVPVSFRWRLPPRMQGVVSVSPSSGTLRGNESVQLLWSFAPAAQKVYEGRAACLILSSPDGGAVAAGLLAATPGATSEENGADAAAVDGDAGDGVTLSLVGEGTQGAVALDPPSLQLGDLRVGHPLRRPLLLQNVSDGVLRYNLEVVAAEDDEAPAGEATPCDLTTGLDAAAAGTVGLECWVDEPEGALPARASRTVNVTFFPRFRKRYSLQVRCRSSTVSPLLVGANRPPSGGRLLAPADGATGNGVAGNGAVDPASLPPPVIAPLTATVTFPTLEITDVHSEGLSKPLLWQLLGVNDLNQHLRTEVTVTELRLRAAQDRGSLTTEAACAALRPFPMDFGTHGLDGKPRVVYLELSNPTPLPVAWQLHSFDDPDGVELENWVEPGRPLTDQERMRHHIAEQRLFELRPRSGTLEPGARGTVTLEFRPRVEGAFELPVFLHVTDGKRSRLQLHATTTSEPRQLLSLPPALRTFRLAPVALGEPRPPLQMYTLHNGGPAPLRWRLDTAPLDALAAESWGHRVLELVGPAGGQIPVGGLAAINWRFSPLEVKEYRLRVRVLLGDGSSDAIELVGRGYAPPPSLPHGAASAVAVSQSASAKDEGLEADAEAATAAATMASDRDWATWQGLSSAPSAGMAGRLALVDHDLVSMGVTPLRGLSRRIIVLTNKSRYPLAFEWDLAALAPPPGVSGPPLPSADLLTGQPLQAALAITPAAGSLDPGERLVCRIAMHAGVTPQLFEGEVRCSIRVHEEALEEAAAAAGAVASATEAEITVERVEEVIAEDPVQVGPPPLPPALAAAQRTNRLRSRLPVHAYMTTAIRARIEPLAQQYAATLELRTRRAAETARAGMALPEPQVICVTLTGQVLDDEQLATLRYVPTHERHLAVAAVTEGACWVPPTTVAFWERFAPSTPHSEQQQSSRMLGSRQSLSAMPSVSDIAFSQLCSPDGAWPGLDANPRTNQQGATAQQPGPWGPPSDLSLDLAAVLPRSGPSTPMLQGFKDNGLAPIGDGDVRSEAGPSTAKTTNARDVVDVTFTSAIPGINSRLWSDAGSSAAAAQRKPSSTGDGVGASASGCQSGMTTNRSIDGSADGGGLMEMLSSVPANLTPPALPPPAPTGGGLEHDALVSAREVLSGLFSELLDDPDLRRALEFLPEEEIPCFATVRYQVAPCYDPHVRAEAAAARAAEAAAARAAEAANEQLAEEGVPTDPAAAASSPQDTLMVVPQGEVYESAPGFDGSALANGSPFTLAMVHNDDVATPAAAMAEPEVIAQQPEAPTLEQELDADNELRRVLVSPEWKMLADFVLESALLGLMQESAAGDWEMPVEGEQ